MNPIRRVLVAAMFCVLSTAPWETRAQDESLGVGVEPNTAGCTYNFGSGNFQWCVSSAGNLQKLTSPAGAEHIAFGAVIEGNVVCVNDVARYYDRGSLINVAGWGAPVVVAGPTASSVTVRLVSVDGVFQLDQKWTRDTTERDLTLQMTLQNIGGSVVGPVRLMRMVDIDPNSNPSSQFDKSRYAVWFRSTDAVSVIGLTLSPAPQVTVAAQTTVSTLPPPCTPAALATPGGGTTTAVAVIAYDFGTMNAGQKKIVKIGYQVQ